MHLDDIRKVLRHCYGRQAESGAESAFRFALFMGPRRKHLFAEYPDTQDGPSKSQQTRSKKKKGKQREDALDGLYQIEETLEPTPDHIDSVGSNPNEAGPSNYQSPGQDVSDPQQDLVRIDMGQMLQLREMGYEVVGPVNGPSEGYPEYEVSRAILATLIAHIQSHSAPAPSAADIASSSAPVTIDPALLSNETSLLPSVSRGLLQNTGLHAQPPIHLSTAMVRPTTPNSNAGSVDNTQPPIPSSTSIIRPITPPNNNAGSADNTNGIQRTPKKGRGKRAQANANLSPQTARQTRSTKKKKKITDDDRAAMEAQNMVQSGTRRRTKTTRRKQ
jgi:hypothetical protein